MHSEYTAAVCMLATTTTAPDTTAAVHCQRYLRAKVTLPDFCPKVEIVPPKEMLLRHSCGQS